jgi:hypothetical protein
MRAAVIESWTVTIAEEKSGPLQSFTSRAPH